MFEELWGVDPTAVALCAMVAGIITLVLVVRANLASSEKLRSQQELQRLRSRGA